MSGEQAQMWVPILWGAVGILAAIVLWLLREKYGWWTSRAEQAMPKSQCRQQRDLCRKDLAAQLHSGDSMFSLLLEGHALLTQAVLAMCHNNDESCAEIRRQLNEHNRRLITPREREAA